MSDSSGFEILMPFVTVASKGGPHDDSSYAAGWEMGALDKLLTQCSITDRRTLSMVLRADNREQADLIAMLHGYEMVVITTADEFWIGAEFTSGAIQ